jgi:hypothetical protein
VATGLGALRDDHVDAGSRVPQRVLRGAGQCVLLIDVSISCDRPSSPTAMQTYRIV